MAKPFIVTADGVDKNLFQQLSAIDEFEVHPESKVTQDNLKDLLPRIHGLVIRSATTVNEQLLENAPNLKYVIRAGEGTDNIDKKLCQQKGVKVSNTPGANNNSAAEHAIALMMTVLRKTAAAHSTMKNGGWDKNKFTGNELSNKTIGIVGFGRIGQIVAKRLSGFEPKIKFFDPFVETSEMNYCHKAKDLQEIFSICDIITLHTPLTDETRGLVGEELLALMKEDAILINCARGGIVDEVALTHTLKNKKIRGAGFDVFAVEPLDKNSPLRILDNLVMTPHLGAATDEAQYRVGEMVIHQLKEFFLNENLLNEVRV